MFSIWEAIVVALAADVVSYACLKIPTMLNGKWSRVLLPRSPLQQLFLLVGLFAMCTALVIGFSESNAPSFPYSLHIRNDRPMIFEELTIDPLLGVVALRWGEGKALRQISPTIESQLDLPRGLPKKLSKDQKRFELVLPTLALNLVEPLYVPEQIEVDIRPPDQGQLYVFVCTNKYHEANRIRVSRNFWTYKCYIGKPGISDFYDIRSGRSHEFLDDGFGFGSEFGSVAAIFVVQQIGKKPRARSRFLIVIRKGIRDPDDIWQVNGQPVIWSHETGCLVDSRIAFQSWEVRGNDFDLFTCHIDGSKLRCLTKKFPNCYDGLFPDRSSSKEACWISPNRIQFYSNRSADKQRRLYEIVDKGGSKAVLVK